MDNEVDNKPIKNEGTNVFSILREHQNNKRIGPPVKYNGDTLLQGAEEYFNIIDSNPMEKVKWVNDKKIIEECKLPYTIQGLCAYLGINTNTYYEYKENKDKSLSDSACVIDQAIYDQKYSLAATGILKENIIIRDLKLKDTTEGTTVINNITALTTSELSQLAQTIGSEYGDTVIDITPEPIKISNNKE